MCGRYALHSPPAVIGAPLQLEPPADPWPARYNIAPGGWIPGVRQDESLGQPRFDQFWWGYRPYWATQDAPQPINAKAENLDRSRYFRGAFHRHRCLIPADGWYEWLNDADCKQPHYISRADRQPLYLAGIWTLNAEQQDSCALVTEPARGPLQQIHARMPLVLDDASLTAWLDPHLCEREAISAAVHHLPVTQLISWPVSTRVNRATQDDPSLIEPLSS